MSPTFASLRVPNYRRYFTGMVVSNTGTWMQRVAQDWLVLQLTGGNGTWLGIVTALQFLPLPLFGLAGGLLADRLPKRRILAATNAFMGLTALILGVLTLTGVVRVWEVATLAFALGLGTAADNPARQSFVIEIVGPTDLTNAVALNSASFNLARLLGPGIAGLLIEAFGGTGWVFVLNAVSFAAPLIALWRMRPDQLRPATPAARGRGQVREGIAYVRGRPDLVAVLVVVFFAGTFGLNFQITNALMATHEFGKGAGQYGLLGSVLAVGSLSGALLAARRGAVQVWLVMAAALVFGVLEVVVGLMPSYLWYAVALPPVGIASMTTMNAANASMQLSVAPAMRGRVMSLYLAVFFGGTPIGAPVVGWLADQYGPRWSLIGGGSVTAVAAVLAALWLARHSGTNLGSALPFPRRPAQLVEPNPVGAPQVDTTAPAGFE
jgi:MFS family permease